MQTAQRSWLVVPLLALTLAGLAWFVLGGGAGDREASLGPSSPAASEAAQETAHAASLGAADSLGTAAAPEPFQVADRRSLADSAAATAEEYERFLGRVLDGTGGGPIEGLRATWSKPPALPGAGEPEPAAGSGQQIALSDAGGRFVLPWPGPGDLWLSHPDYVPLLYPSLELQDDFVAQLERGASLSGRVLDYNEKTLADAEVLVWRCDGETPLGKAFAETQTDTLGRFSFRGLRAGTFLVRAQPAHGDPEETDRARQAVRGGIELAPGGQAELQLVFADPTMLALRLEVLGHADAAEGPAGGVQLDQGTFLIEVQPRWDYLPAMLTERATWSLQWDSSLAELSIGPLEAGTLGLTCWTPWAQCFKREAVVPQADRLLWTLPVARNLSGSVRADGGALPGALIALIEADRSAELTYATALAALSPSPEAPPRLLATRSDAQGIFRFALRPAGVDLRCLVWPPAWSAEQEPNLLAPASGRISPQGLLERGGRWVPLEFTLQRSTSLNGWVRCSDGGAPAGARVLLAPWNEPGSEPSQLQEADSNGAFRFDVTPTRVALVGARMDGYRDAVAQLPALDDPATQRSKTIELVLHPICKLNGCVLDWDGRAMPGAEIVARKQGLELARSQADSSGRFRFADLDPGVLEFEAKAPQTSLTSGSRQVLRLPTETELILRLRPEPPQASVSFSGTVVQAATVGLPGEFQPLMDDPPVPGLFVRGLGPHAVLHQSGIRIRIEGIRYPAGPFEMGAPGFETLSLPRFSVAAGGQRELPRLELRPVLTVHFTGLDELLKIFGPAQRLPFGFLLLEELPPAGAASDEAVDEIDLAALPSDPNGAPLASLPTAVYRLSLPSADRAATFTLLPNPAVQNLHLPGLFKD